MNDRLEEQVGVLLNRLKLTIAVAESATGGLISDLITNIPGSSNYFRGSVISYDNDIKTRVLGVKQDTLKKHGAVSYQTAREMAEGVKKLMKTDIGLSDTGIAGPDGATPEKPVGLFYIGLSTGIETRVERYLFNDKDRIKNKQDAAEAALLLLQEYLLKRQ